MQGMGDGIGGLFVFLFCFFPLGVWKAGEIIYWVFKHLHWS